MPACISLRGRAGREQRAPGDQMCSPGHPLPEAGAASSIAVADELQAVELVSVRNGPCLLLYACRFPEMSKLKNADFFWPRLRRSQDWDTRGGGARKKVPIWHARGGHEKNVVKRTMCVSVPKTSLKGAK